MAPKTLLASALLGALLLPTSAVRQNLKIEEAEKKWFDFSKHVDAMFSGSEEKEVEKIEGMMVHCGVCNNHSGEPLVPEVVPGKGKKAELYNKERANMFYSSEYSWYFNGEMFAKLAPVGLLSSTFGQQKINVTKVDGSPLFLLRSTKSWINPTHLRVSWRVMESEDGDGDDALYTINKDLVGTGEFGMQEEWFIYRGRESGGDLKYYLVGDPNNFDLHFHHSKEEYEAKKPDCGKIVQETETQSTMGAYWLPDRFRLIVEEGEDAALMMCVSTIVDIANDHIEKSSGGSSAYVASGR